MIPVFNKGSKNSKLNYRPVSILTNISIVYERLSIIRTFKGKKNRSNYRELQLWEVNLISPNRVSVVDLYLFPRAGQRGSS